MTNSSNIYNIEIETPGDLLVFDVPCKDYYKIALIEEIEEVETEIMTTFETLDSGQCKYVNVFDKTSLRGIQNILDNHMEQELLNINDEVTITVGGEPWAMQVAAIDLYESHEVIFVSKYIYASTALPQQANVVMTNNNILSILENQFYASINESDKQYIKQKQKQGKIGSATTVSSRNCYVWILNYNEVSTSTAIASYTVPVVAFPSLTTAASRIKTWPNGTAGSWWLADMGSGANSHFYAFGVNTSGVTIGDYPNGMIDTSTNGVVPCFHLTADR